MNQAPNTSPKNFTSFSVNAPHQEWKALDNKDQFWCRKIRNLTIMMKFSLLENWKNVQAKKRKSLIDFLGKISQKLRSWTWKHHEASPQSLYLEPSYPSPLPVIIHSPPAYPRAHVLWAPLDPQNKEDEILSFDLWTPYLDLARQPQPHHLQDQPQHLQVQPLLFNLNFLARSTDRAWSREQLRNRNLQIWRIDRSLKRLSVLEFWYIGAMCSKFYRLTRFQLACFILNLAVMFIISKESVHYI